MEEEISYRLTPKGWLCAQLDCDIQKTERIWSALEAYALARIGGEGIPALVMDGLGGAFVRADREDKEAAE